MKIILEEDLKNYLHEHKHHTLSLQLIHSDYNGSNLHVHQPNIHYSQPSNLDQFDEYLVDDFKVYVEKHIQAQEDTLKFTHQKLIGAHFCSVEGLKLNL